MPSPPHFPKKSKVEIIQLFVNLNLWYLFGLCYILQEQRIDLKFRKKNSTDILLIHGDSDQVVSPNFMLEAKDFFIRNNVQIDTHLIKNCDHHIPIEASSIALNYILKKI